jgi:hypothetical protein
VLFSRHGSARLALVTLHRLGNLANLSIHTGKHDETAASAFGNSAGGVGKIDTVADATVEF